MIPGAHSTLEMMSFQVWRLLRIFYFRSKGEWLLSASGVVVVVLLSRGVRERDRESESLVMRKKRRGALSAWRLLVAATIRKTRAEVGGVIYWYWWILIVWKAFSAGGFRIKLQSR